MFVSEKFILTKSYFITGTDTEVGKTFVSCLLLKKFSQLYKRTVGFKPIASGGTLQECVYVNEDTLAMQQASSYKLPINQLNTFTFKPPIAPHIAAKQQNQLMNIQQISETFHHLKEQSDLIIVEGAGGWRVPISDKEYLSSWVQHEHLEVILVVNMKLGCLNHAVLTAESIRHDGLKLAGWVANTSSVTMPYYDENIAFLTKNIEAPKLGEIPYLSTELSNEALKYLSLESL